MGRLARKPTFQKPDERWNHPWMTLLSVDKRGIYRPVHSGHGPRGQFGIEVCPFANECETVTLFDQCLHLRGMGCSGIRLDLYPRISQQFQQPPMGVGMPLRLVENLEIIL